MTDLHCQDCLFRLPTLLLLVPALCRLTYNYGVDSYDIGEGFGHFAIATNDVYKLCDEVGDFT